MATASGDVVRQCNDIFCYSAPTQAFVMDDSLDIKIQNNQQIFSTFSFLSDQQWQPSGDMKYFSEK